MTLVFTDRNEKTVLHSWGRFRATAFEDIAVGDLVALKSATGTSVQFADDASGQAAIGVACENIAATETGWCCLAAELKAPTTIGTGGAVTQTYFDDGTDVDIGQPLYLDDEGKCDETIGATTKQQVGYNVARDRILLVPGGMITGAGAFTTVSASGAVSLSSTLGVTGIATFGASGSGVDVILWGGTASNYVQYDASDGELEIVNTAKQALSIASTLTGASALRAVSWAVADQTTQSSGYNAAFLMEVTMTGAATPTEYSGGRFNLLLDTGTKTGNWNALKAKIGTGAAPTLTGAGVNGIFVSIDEIGTCSTLAGVNIEMYTTSNFTNSFFIWCKHQGASAVVDSMLGMWGLKPDHFLACQNNNANGFFDATATAGDQCIGHLKCRFGTTTGYINVFSDNS